jgi:hypothetical protein
MMGFATLSNDRIKEIKEKVLNWLKEEGYSPQENNDPKAHYNISIKVGSMGLGCSIIHDIRFPDNLFVAVNIRLPEEKITFYKNMTAQKKNDFLWDLRMTLVKETELGSFETKFGSSFELQSIFLTSKRVYYDELTKGRLISTIVATTRITTMVAWMVEKAEGIMLARNANQKLSYST